jgi:hypothetical protein
VAWIKEILVIVIFSSFVIHPHPIFLYTVFTFALYLFATLFIMNSASFSPPTNYFLVSDAGKMGKFSGYPDKYEEDGAIEWERQLSREFVKDV